MLGVDNGKAKACRRGEPDEGNGEAGGSWPPTSSPLGMATNPENAPLGANIVQGVDILWD